MKKFLGWAVATAMTAGTMPAAPAFADAGANYAKESCSDRIRRDYDASTQGVTASQRGYGRYDVTGQARRNGQVASFTCRTDRASVQSLRIGSWRKGGNDTGKAVAAVGIAVGLAAIIAAASSKKKKNDQYDRYGRPDYDRYNNDRSYNDDSYSPGNGMTCYRSQRACFDSYDNYNARWTQREFGY